MRRALAILTVALFALVGCSSSSDNEPSTGDQAQAAEEAPFELDAAPLETTEVNAVKSYKFDPQVIEVNAGSEVTWTNEDDFPHNVHLLDGSDETHDLPIGDSVSVAFDEPGDYYYECSLHAQTMRGKVIVSE
ncbi:MAG: plastocyanin/azurin family copper-binding protein [Actinomycetota bacterium]|nr:plastocyanin/azurin family copper-binding protein [Actinomycetota bacterium]